MTDRFDEATRLKNLLGQREAIIKYAARLSKLYMLIDIYHPDNDEDLEMIEYLLKAAKIMEERE